MRTFGRHFATGQLFATLIALGACSDRDHTEVCVGPGCPSYDGIAGESSFAGSGGTSSNGTGGVGGSGESGSAGEGGSAGVPEGGVDPLPDGGPPGDACEVVFVTPGSVDAGSITLGGSDDVDSEACGAAFTTNVALSSNASTVNLFVNGNPIGLQAVSDGAVVFEAVLGNRGDTPNVLRAEAEMADGTTCSVTFGGDVFVDCAGPSCSIESPVANDEGFLNASQDADDQTAGLQTDVVVNTELEHVGRTVRLEVDDAFLASGADVVANGSDGSATFQALTLTEGVRSVRAECRDAEGVVTLSPIVEWDVDITPCGLTLDSVAGGADPITRLHDADSNPSNGLQVLLSGEVSANDCEVVEVGECDGALTSIDLPEGAGDGFSVPVTLGNETTSLEVCARVEDRAGNVSSPDTRIAVNVRSSDPAVAISTPSTGARFNVAGTSGAIADAEPLSANSCETDVVVDCTDVGEDVELFVNGASVGEASCAAQGGLGGSFQGQATFASVSLPTQNDGVTTATLSAQQTVDGLEGVSANVVVQADCEAPSCSITAPPASTFLSAADDSSGDAGLQVSFIVQTDPEGVGQTLALRVDGASSGSEAAVAGGGGAIATFADVSLLEGSRDVQAECVDPAGNSDTSDVETWVVDTLPCTTTLVVAGGANPVTPLNDLDGLLADLQVSVTGQTAGNCATARVGVCGALASTFTPLELDGSFSLETTISDDTGSVEVCAEILDLANNLGTQSVSVNVDGDAPSLTITSPLDAAILTSNTPDCDPGTLGLQVEVTGTSDAAAGSPVQVTLGSGAAADTTVTGGATYTACVEALHGDAQTLTASVSDTLTGLENSASITVSVDSQPPGSIAAPTFAVTSRRGGTLDLNWLSVLDTDDDPLAAYRLRCAATDITTEEAWTAATDIPVAITPPDTAGVEHTVGLTSFRTGTTRFCVVRGEDDNGQLSAISAGLSATVSNPFLTQEYAVADDSNTAVTINTVTVEPLGDINGDGIDDFASGVINSTAGGTARIFFGANDLDDDLQDVGAPSLTITRTVSTNSGFGGEVSGLGDISGDGIPDFAVSARAPATNTVYVFFGRSTNDWPATIDVSAGCAASLCVVGTAVPTGGGLFSWDVHAADFDGSGINDLVISARTASGTAGGAGRVYVLLGGAQLAAGGTLTIPADTVTTTGEPDGFFIDPPATRAHFGVSVTAVDDAGEDDLIIGANGDPPGAFVDGTNGVVFFLAGRAYTAGAGGGLVAISSTDLVEVDSGVTGNYGNPVRALDFNGDGVTDFVVGHDYAAEGAARVFLRNGVSGPFSNAAPFMLNFDGDLLDDNWGLYMGNGQHPSLRLLVADGPDLDTDPDSFALGDLDKDGFTELLVGSDDPDAAGSAVFGQAQLFYGSAASVGRLRSTADFNYISTRGQAVPNFVGDINDDGFNDIAILDSGFGSNVLFLLY